MMNRFALMVMAPVSAFRPPRALLLSSLQNWVCCLSYKWPEAARPGAKPGHRERPRARWRP